MTVPHKPVLKANENIRRNNLSERQKAEYAYALSCCKFPASVNPSAFQQRVIRLCDAKLREINGSLDSISLPANRKFKVPVHKADYISREKLIEIADYIRLTIVDSGKISEHLPLINAILSTGIPCFAYPKIAWLPEKDVNRLVKSHTMSHMDLAPIYHTLRSLTLKPGYLNLFEKTVRHAYFALAKIKTYPNIGIDKNNPQFVS